MSGILPTFKKMFLELLKTLIHKTVDKYSPELYKSRQGPLTDMIKTRTWLLSLLLQRLHTRGFRLSIFCRRICSSLVSHFRTFALGPSLPFVCPFLSDYLSFLSRLGVPLSHQWSPRRAVLGSLPSCLHQRWPARVLWKGARWEAQEMLNHHGAALSSCHSTSYCSCCNYTCNPAD